MPNFYVGAGNSLAAKGLYAYFTRKGFEVYDSTLALEAKGILVFGLTRNLLSRMIKSAIEEGSIGSDYKIAIAEIPKGKTLSKSKSLAVGKADKPSGRMLKPRRARKVVKTDFPLPFKSESTDLDIYREED